MRGEFLPQISDRPERGLHIGRVYFYGYYSRTIRNGQAQWADFIFKGFEVKIFHYTNYCPQVIASIRYAFSNRIGKTHLFYHRLVNNDGLGVGCQF